MTPSDNLEDRLRDWRNELAGAVVALDTLLNSPQPDPVYSDEYHRAYRHLMDAESHRVAWRDGSNSRRYGLPVRPLNPDPVRVPDRLRQDVLAVLDGMRF